MEIAKALLICFALLLSSAIIFTILIKYKMKYAAMLFIPVMGVLLCYIPFYFGGLLTIPMMQHVYANDSVFQIFACNMKELLQAPEPFMTSASIFTLLVAFIMLFATVLLVVSTACEVIRIIKKCCLKNENSERRKRCQKLVFTALTERCLDKKNSYLQFSRLLN